MKRVALLCLGLAMGGVTVAEAQLTMQMSNGWSFTFGGNVNAFLVYEKQSDVTAPTVTPGGLIGSGGEGATRIRTGLLPAFAVFDAKGKEGNTDLGVHFGFAPQIQCGPIDVTGDGIPDQAVAHDCFGAQIDMRQVYLTLGGSWGQILAGRELALFGRQNILTDQTLFGIGATGGQFSGGTTLGRIGFGYIYPQFVAQMTFSTAAGRPFQLSVGLFDPSSNAPYTTIELPRLEAEGVYTSGNVKIWAGGLVQSNGTGGVVNTKATSWGGSGGLRFGNPTFSLTASGYYGKGLGTTLLFNLGTADAGSGSDDLRKSMGGIGQLTFTPSNSKMTLAGSWGISILEDATDDPAPFKTKNWLASGGIYYQATKSLKAVAEFNYAVTGDDSDLTDDNKSVAPAVGFMLFF